MMTMLALALALLMSQLPGEGSKRERNLAQLQAADKLCDIALKTVELALQLAAVKVLHINKLGMSHLGNAPVGVGGRISAPLSSVQCFRVRTFADHGACSNAHSKYRGACTSLQHGVQ